MKRLVVGVFVSALTVFGLAPAASAATDGSGIVKVVKAKKIKPVVIDWDSIEWSTSLPTTTTGGVSAQRIDWD